MKKTSIILCLLIFGLNLFSQGPSFQWAKQFGGSINKGTSVTTDAAGNVYSTGYFQATTDFDPGPGVFNLVSLGNKDVYVSKIDASGNFIWAIQFSGSSNEEGISIDVDPLGNLYVAGYYTGTVDFDPGPGTFNVGNPIIPDVFVVKLYPSGSLDWVKTFGGLQDDQALSVIGDAAGNVFIAGFFGGTVDFDPTPSTYTLTANGGKDIFISKIDLMGNLAWTKTIGGTLDDVSFGLALDNFGNLISTGSFRNIIDFDPGPGVFNMGTGVNNDIYVLKIDGSGNFVWAKNFSVSNSGEGRSIVTDASGNIYSTGHFTGNADFDPGIGIANYSCSIGASDMYISKLDPLGNFVWVNVIGSPNIEYGNSISLDASPNIYTCGWFEGSVDFDPGPSVFNLTSAGLKDIYITEYDLNGNFIMAKQMGSISNDLAFGITATQTGEVYTTGYFQFTVDFDPDAGVSNLTSAPSGIDIFIQKLAGNITEIRETENEIRLNVFPNPNNGYFVIESNEVTELTVINELGQTIQTITINPTIQNNIRLNLNAGVYFLKSFSPNMVLTKKFVVIN